MMNDCEHSTKVMLAPCPSYLILKEKLAQCKPLQKLPQDHPSLLPCPALSFPRKIHVNMTLMPAAKLSQDTAKSGVCAYVPADVHAPPPDLAQAAAAQPVKPKKDPMSFPPGLIPQLVAEKLKTDPPYSPLSPLDLDRAGLPPTQEPDSYLKSRIDRFFAELQASHVSQTILLSLLL